VLDYCEHYKNEPLSAIDAFDETRPEATALSEWDKEYIGTDHDEIFEIIMAANYMDIKPLVHVSKLSSDKL
jgi:S-phase kinase-associated protein 1